ncbi:hypothetical protein AJ79_09055 [Helicocarpus griseus UAMH5409]|uniref:Amidoligase enzyme n=1 Tax=Helicocarpus griseus UAMH5409 TaxID=1447875 RepID=A0A2B7WEL6_9EURO|nr:hypothetical protein AJ79_09055 [Helicocarpus griseus UAMH5409]
MEWTGAPAPPPPPPPLPPYVPRGPEQKPSPDEVPKPPPPGSCGIGIETEFLLRARAKPPADETFRLFARRCAAAYNEQVPAQFPRMHSLVQAQWQGIPYTQWVLHHDPTCETQAEPWGIELISPLLRDFPGSVWREDVMAVWDFLARHYYVSGDKNCSTHVHISRAGTFSATDLKRVAQAVIYFEPAFEAILPPDRRANEYTRSNWIDNPNFGYKNLSRDQAIEIIEGLNTVEEVMDTMNPNQSKYFGWNFISVKKFNTIEFRRGSVSLSPEDVFMWVELAMSFIRAAMAVQSKDQFQQYSPTVGGLRNFLRHYEEPEKPHEHHLPNLSGFKESVKHPHLPGQEETRAKYPSYLDRLFTGKSEDARDNPIPVGNLTPEKQSKLRRKIEADSVSNPVLDMVASAQEDRVI